MKLSLPTPISANRYWRIANNRLFRSSDAEQFKRLAAMSARMAGVEKLTGDVEVVITLHPRETQCGTSSKVRVDLDNAIKVTLDSLNDIAWIDDKQVVRLAAQIGPPVKDGGLTVWIGPVQECEL